MQVTVLYDHGKIAFPTEVKLKHECFHIVVNVPDEEVIDSPTVKKERKKGGESLGEVLQKYSQNNLPDDVLAGVQQMQGNLELIRNASSSEFDDAPALTKKQLQRMEAMFAREELRKEQGHTA